MSHLTLTSFETAAIFAVLVVAVISLIYAYLLYRNVMAESKGTERMIQVWTPVKEGADAYLGQQLRTILPFMGVLVFALFASVWIAQPTAEARAMFGEDNARITIAIGRAVAFILGASFSLMVGQLGMRMAVQGNIRVAAASMRDFGDALRIAYRSGTVTGMLTDGLGLLGGTTIFIIFGSAAPDALLGFGFGGTLVALFMRVGGGIYTKAADVGADLVGKVEEGLEEDDPRNAAVIADQVGDNVGDCAGMAADIFESYEVTIVSALILGLALMTLTGQIYWIVFPLARPRHRRHQLDHRHLLRARVGAHRCQGQRLARDGNRLRGFLGHHHLAVLRARLHLHQECRGGQLVAARGHGLRRRDLQRHRQPPDRVLHGHRQVAGPGNRQEHPLRPGDHDPQRPGRRL